MINVTVFVIKKKPNDCFLFKPEKPYERNGHWRCGLCLACSYTQESVAAPDVLFGESARSPTPPGGGSQTNPFGLRPGPKKCFRCNFRQKNVFVVIFREVKIFLGFRCNFTKFLQRFLKICFVVKNLQRNRKNFFLQRNFTTIFFSL